MCPNQLALVTNCAFPLVGAFPSPLLSCGLSRYTTSLAGLDYECVQLDWPWIRIVPFPLSARFQVHSSVADCLSTLASVANCPLSRIVFQHWPRLPIAPFPSSARFRGYFHTASALSWVVFQHWLWLQITPFPLSAFPSRLFSYLRIVLPRLSHFTACCP